MTITYLNGHNLAVLSPESFKTKKLSQELKEILFNDIQEDLKEELENANTNDQ